MGRQLFDLAVDPFETTNLADNADYRDERDRLSGILRKWDEELDDPCKEFWKNRGPSQSWELTSSG
jgi:hypothetical protein